MSEVKTLMDKLFEVFPDARKNNNGSPVFCPSKIGYKEADCLNHKISCVECWSQPYVEPKE